jgi:hypothetical protein
MPSATYVKLPSQFPCQGLDAGLGELPSPNWSVGEPISICTACFLPLGAGCIARCQLVLFYTSTTKKPISLWTNSPRDPPEGGCFYYLLIREKKLVWNPVLPRCDSKNCDGRCRPAPPPLFPKKTFVAPWVPITPWSQFPPPPTPVARHVTSRRRVGGPRLPCKRGRHRHQRRRGSGLLPLGCTPSLSSHDSSHLCYLQSWKNEFRKAWDSKKKKLITQHDCSGSVENVISSLCRGGGGSRRIVSIMVMWVCQKQNQKKIQFLPSGDEGRRKAQGKGCLCVLTVFPHPPSDRGMRRRDGLFFPIMRAGHMSYRFVE